MLFDRGLTESRINKLGNKTSTYRLPLQEFLNQIIQVNLLVRLCVWSVHDF